MSEIDNDFLKSKGLRNYEIMKILNVRGGSLAYYVKVEGEKLLRYYCEFCEVFEVEDFRAIIAKGLQRHRYPMLKGKIVCGCNTRQRTRILAVCGVDHTSGLIYPREFNQLTVVGKSDVVKGGKKLLKVTCNVCSLDSEVYPDSFLCGKSDLEKGVNPCGCGKSGVNIKQATLLFNKKYLHKYKITGWKKQNTGAYNSTPIVYCFTHEIENSRSKFNRIYDGVSLPCTRCSTEVKELISRYPKSRLLLELLTTLNHLKGYFVGLDKFIGLKTVCYWVCPEGHFTRSVSECLIKQEHHCNVCSLNGFQRGKPCVFYLTRFDNTDTSRTYYKIGLTQRTSESRNKRQGLMSNMEFSNIGTLTFNLGEDARLLETTLKNLYKGKNPTKLDFPDGYSETVIAEDSTLQDLLSDIKYLTGLDIIPCRHTDELVCGILPFKSTYVLGENICQ